MRGLPDASVAGQKADRKALEEQKYYLANDTNAVK